MSRIPTLEIGCGDVLDLRFDERMDIQPTRATTKVGDMRDMRALFADETFAVIKCSATIEHVDPDGQFQTADEMYRVLVPNGIVIVQTPDLDYWEDKRVNGTDSEKAWAEVQMKGGMRDEFDFHKGLMGAKSLRRLFEYHGFKTLWLRDGNEAAGSLDAAFQKIGDMFAQ